MLGLKTASESDQSQGLLSLVAYLIYARSSIIIVCRSFRQIELTIVRAMLSKINMLHVTYMQLRVVWTLPIAESITSQYSARFLDIPRVQSCEKPWTSSAAFFHSSRGKRCLRNYSKSQPEIWWLLEFYSVQGSSSVHKQRFVTSTGILWFTMLMWGHKNKTVEARTA